MGDILNAYVQAPATEKVWTVLGSEFGKDVCKTTLIIRALYRLKSEGAAFRSCHARCMKSMGHESCKANQDLWLKPDIRPEDGLQYYYFILCYVNDILCIHHSVDAVLQQLHQSLPLKLGFCSQVMYLGAKLHNTRLHNGVWVSAISPLKYVCEAVRNMRPT